MKNVRYNVPKNSPRDPGYVELSTPMADTLADINDCFPDGISVLNKRLPTATGVALMRRGLLEGVRSPGGTMFTTLVITRLGRDIVARAKAIGHVEP